MGKKQEVITKLFEICQKRRDYVFDNDMVKKVCDEIGFGNPFDVTKIDKIEVLPERVRELDYALIHLGSGRHRFVKGLEKVFHPFENTKGIIEWPYRQSLLNEYNTSESNILSVANNQRILHHFLFGEDTEFASVDIAQRPKTYFPHRTKTSFEYTFGPDITIQAENIQIEVDVTIEFNGVISIFEAKNGNPDNFSVYQLFHPALYYHQARQQPAIGKKMKEILCVYVVRQVIESNSELKLWCYKFTNPTDLTSIKLQKSACYRLIKQ
jgi:hypothetical protein